MGFLQSGRDLMPIEFSQKRIAVAVNVNLHP
jgi:hypothetical protein